MHLNDLIEQLAFHVDFQDEEYEALSGELTSYVLDRMKPYFEAKGIAVSTASDSYCRTEVRAHLVVACATYPWSESNKDSQWGEILLSCALRDLYTDYRNERKLEHCVLPSTVALNVEVEGFRQNDKSVSLNLSLFCIDESDTGEDKRDELEEDNKPAFIDAMRKQLDVLEATLPEDAGLWKGCSLSVPYVNVPEGCMYRKSGYDGSVKTKPDNNAPSWPREKVEVQVVHWLEAFSKEDPKEEKKPAVEGTLEFTDPSKEALRKFVLEEKGKKLGGVQLKTLEESLLNRVACAINLADDSKTKSVARAPLALHRLATRFVFNLSDVENDPRQIDTLICLIVDDLYAGWRKARGEAPFMPVGIRPLEVQLVRTVGESGDAFDISVFLTCLKTSYNPNME